MGPAIKSKTQFLMDRKGNANYGKPKYLATEN